jgi:tRNA (guanine26-N2/guanine27-N2)-dimethyltransferase
MKRHAISSAFPVKSAAISKMSSSISGVVLDITAPPATGQNLLHEGNEYTTIKEGLAHILIPASAAKTPQTTPKGDNEAQSVFYNPIQQFNRDLSVLAIKAYGEQVLERKAKSLEANKQKNAAKRRDKKRKREEDGLNSEASRKAGKLDDGATEVQSAANGGIGRQAIILEGGQSQLGKGYVSTSEDGVEGKVQDAPMELPSSTTPAQPDAMETSIDKSEASENVQAQTNTQNPKITPSPPFTILDALSATGLRALRYAQEIPFTTSITANDLLPEATKTIEMNVRHNRLEHKINAVTGNALSHMYSLVGENCRDDKGRPVPSLKYDVIDLDPYGTAAPFLDAAVQSVRDDGGLLCVTCTDAGVWASNGYPEKAYSLYGGIPIKGLHSHEGGLRLILHAIATSAARYGLAIEPLLSLSIDFYARVFVRIHKSPADVKFLAGKTMVVYNCDTGCSAWTTQMVARNKLVQNKNKKGYFWKHVFGQAPNANETCNHCGMKTHMAGPMYAGPLHSADFIKKILADLPNVSKDTYQTTTRIEGMLTLALEELLPLPEDPNSPSSASKTRRYDPAELDHFPFLFLPGVLSKVLHCVTPDENSLRGALRHLGYRVTRSHTKPGSIKTDAPWEVIWEVMREWVRQKSPIKEGALRKGTAGYKIMGLDKSEKEPVEEEANGDESTKEKADEKEDGRDAAPVDETPKKIEIVFDEKLGKEKDARKLVRYQLNPRENWGPMNRAKGKA